jgi:hypothetical protein
MKRLTMKGIKQNYEIISLVKDYNEDVEFILLKVSDYTLNVNDKMTDILGIDHKKEIKIGDYEIFDTSLQNTYGFCRLKGEED